MSFEGYMKNDIYSKIEDELPQENISQEKVENEHKVEESPNIEESPIQNIDLNDIKPIEKNANKRSNITIDKEMMALIVILIAIIYYMMG